MSRTRFFPRAPKRRIPKRRIPKHLCRYLRQGFFEPFPQPPVLDAPLVDIEAWTPRQHAMKARLQARRRIMWGTLALYLALYGTALGLAMTHHLVLAVLAVFLAGISMGLAKVWVLILLERPLFPPRPEGPGQGPYRGTA